MCGIAGFFHPEHVPASAGPHVSAIVGGLHHRGPEFQQVSAPDSNCLLGHTRLAIVDLNPASNQPMSWRDRYWTAYNGEIFNWKELRRELESHYTFTTSGDTEVLLAAWDRWGPDCQHRFNGMWAFALYDKAEKTLWLCRDRFGIKPLYYTARDGGLYFSSEIKALHKGVCPDQPYFVPVLEQILSGSLEAHASTNTYITGIHAVSAGGLLKINAAGTGESTWYSAPDREVAARYEARVEEFRDLFDQAVRMRLQADVPSATCLSGGLDSSSIVSWIQHLRVTGKLDAPNYRHISFIAAFPDSFLDETPYARQLADLTGLELDIIRINPPDPDRLTAAVHAMDGPMHSLAFYPTWELFGEIKRRGITVTLDGQGPDELMGGYLTRRVFETAIESALYRFDLPRLADINRTIRSMGEENGLLKNQQATAAAHTRFVLGALRRRQRTFGSLKDAFRQHSDSQFFQTPMMTILQQVDRCSMAHAVECRMPFMDYRLVEFIRSLPDADRLGGGYSKRILRDAMAGVLPDALRLRKSKIGFNAPLNEWLTGSLKTWSLDILNSAAFQESAWFDGRRAATDLTGRIMTGSVTWADAWSAWPKLNLALLEAPNAATSGFGKI